MIPTHDRRMKPAAGLRVIALTPNSFQALLQPGKMAAGSLASSSLTFSLQVRTLYKLLSTRKLTRLRITAFATIPIRSLERGTLTVKAGLTGSKFHDLRHQAITFKLFHHS